MESLDVLNAKSMRKLVLSAPLRCDVLGEGQFLHPIHIMDQFVIDGQLKELFSKLTKTIDDEDIRNMQLSQALMMVTIQASLRKTSDKNAEAVFSTLDEAYETLVRTPENTLKIFGMFCEGVELVEAEKKS